MICLEFISLNNLDIGTFTLVVTEAADLCRKFSLDSQQRTLEVPEVAEKPSTHKYGSIGGNVANVQFPTCERSTTPLPTDFMDPNMCSVPNAYSPYYYRGYDGPINKWEDYPRYVNTDGVEMAPGVYGDNGSLTFHHGYGYASYGAYPPAGSHVPTMGHDGLLYGPQRYQYPAHYYQPPAPPSAPNQSRTIQGEVCTSFATDQVPFPVHSGNKNTHGIPNRGPRARHFKNQKGRGNRYFGYENEHLDGLNELNRGPRARHFKNQKGRGNGDFGYGNEHLDGLNELNRGPRAPRHFKNQKGRGNGDFGGYGNEHLDGLNELNRGPRARHFSAGFVFYEDRKAKQQQYKKQVWDEELSDGFKDELLPVPDYHPPAPPCTPNQSRTIQGDRLGSFFPNRFSAKRSLCCTLLNVIRLGLDLICAYYATKVSDSDIKDPSQTLIEENGVVLMMQ